MEKTNKSAWSTPVLEKRDVEENTENGGFLMADATELSDS